MPATANIIEANLFAAWTGILLGFLSGLVFVLFFHRENWLGGYGSFRRRLYRLGHISFFGLAVVNFMFYLTARTWSAENQWIAPASWAFIFGAVTMPLCCFIVAHFPKARLLFGLPVVSLLFGAALTIPLLFGADHRQAASPPSPAHASRITHHSPL